MKVTQFYAGTVSLSVSIAIQLLGWTTIQVSFSDVSLSTMTIYPTAFFALLGLLLIHHSLKPLWQK